VSLFYIFSPVNGNVSGYGSVYEWSFLDWSTAWLGYRVSGNAERMDSYLRGVFLFARMRCVVQRNTLSVMSLPEECHVRCAGLCPWSGVVKGINQQQLELPGGALAPVNLIPETGKSQLAEFAHDAIHFW